MTPVAVSSQRPTAHCLPWCSHLLVIRLIWELVIMRRPIVHLWATLSDESLYWAQKEIYFPFPLCSGWDTNATEKSRRLFFPTCSQMTALINLLLLLILILLPFPLVCLPWHNENHFHSYYQFWWYLPRIAIHLMNKALTWWNNSGVVWVGQSRMELSSISLHFTRNAVKHGCCFQHPIVSFLVTQIKWYSVWRRDTFSQYEYFILCVNQAKGYLPLATYQLIWICFSLPYFFWFTILHYLCSLINSLIYLPFESFTN